MWQRLLKSLQTPPAQDPAARRRLASAVLLLECARADFEHQPAELAAVREELARSFGLSAAELDTLLQRAGDEQQQAVSLHAYTADLNRQLSPEERRELIAMLWRVAYADGHLDAHEEHLLRKLADLLYVSHSVFVNEKLIAAGQRA